MTVRRLGTAALLSFALAACSSAGAAPSSAAALQPGGPAKGSAPGSAPAPATDGSSVDLGSAPAGTAISFDVPPGTLGFTITASATLTSDDYLGVAELRDPTGASVVASYVDVAQPGQNLAGQNGVGLFTLRVPLVDDHAAAPIPSGSWTVTFGGATRTAGAAKGTTTPWSGDVHGGVRFQITSDGAFHGGTIDLDLYVPEGLHVDAHTLDATSAPTDGALGQRLDIAFALFQRLYGVDRGEVRYHAIPSSALSIASQDAVDAANALATSGHASAQVILTNHLDPDGAGGDISGLSNCLPGAVGVPGTACSAIIVSLRADSPMWMDASVIVHELGHFVGLQHTTEFDGEADALADTPVCTATGKSALASCPDHDNLMFPSVNLADSEAAIAVSDTQRGLFRSSSVYRAR